jgi:hypothetical protein
VTGVVSEGLIVLGPVAAEVVLALLYALSVLCWWRVARRMGPAVGIVAAVSVLAFPGYVLLFHRLASDALYASAFALAALLTARFVEARSALRAAALGAVFALLVLVRPVSQLLIVLAPLLLFGRGAWRPRLGALAAFATAAVLPLIAWAGHNATRAEDFTILRGGGYSLPFYRAFVVDRIVMPANGDATRELARAVEADLLPREPYRSYAIDLDSFFTSGSARMQEDLIGLSDRTWGWDDDHAHMGRVGREAVRAHPATYARGVARDTWRLLWWPLFLAVEDDDGAQDSTLPGSSRTSQATEGEAIPSASVSAFITTPDGRFQEVWTSPTTHEIVARDPAHARHLDRMNRRVDYLLGRFSDRYASADLGTWLNRASRWFPRPGVWLAIGLIAVAFRRPRGLTLSLVLSAAALLVIVGTALAVPAAAEYSIPVAPAFFVLAAQGLLGGRRSPGVASNE